MTRQMSLNSSTGIYHAMMPGDRHHQGVKGPAESVNYHSFFTDGTAIWSKEHLKPYPANGGKWKFVKRK